jgi:hypothetical protein
MKLREEFGFHHHCDTLLRWRHRFLRFISPNPATCLTGIIQVDETYFRKCFKGHRTWADGGQIDGRPARKRGGASKRGLSREQVPVLTAIDSNSDIRQETLRDRKRVTIITAIRPWVKEQSVICSDGEAAYRSLAQASNCAYVRVQLKAKSNPAIEPRPDQRLPQELERPHQSGLPRRQHRISPALSWLGQAMHAGRRIRQSNRQRDAGVDPTCPTATVLAEPRGVAG